MAGCKGVVNISMRLENALERMSTTTDQTRAANPATLGFHIVSPAGGSTFQIAGGSIWPSIRFHTNGALRAGEQLRWEWRLSWRTWSKSGTRTTNTSFWETGNTLGSCGGRLEVTVSGPRGSASVWIKLLGSSVPETEIRSYLASKPNNNGFERILRHETRMMHFDKGGEPIVSGDLGYGICQLTNPKPTFEQCWHWKLNIDAGLALFAEKQRIARRYLSQEGRFFTAEQLERETIARWNGGTYHLWSTDRNCWMRNPDILCDSCTNNIGWNLRDPRNVGRTEAQLHARDKEKFKRAPNGEDAWFYSGLCYADRILDS
jgi:hypothetical protein